MTTGATSPLRGFEPCSGRRLSEPSNGSLAPQERSLNLSGGWLCRPTSWCEWDHPETVWRPSWRHAASFDHLAPVPTHGLPPNGRYEAVTGRDRSGSINPATAINAQRPQTYYPPVRHTRSTHLWGWTTEPRRKPV